MTVPFSFDSAFDAGMVPDIAQDDEQKVYLFPTSFAQGRLWFLEQIEPGNAAYHLFAALRLRGELVVSALQWSIDALVERHESLRTTFELVEGRPVQAIAPYLSVPLKTIDLSGFEKDEQEALAQHHAQEEVSYPFHLAAGPLLRITLARLEPESHILLVTLHHIVGDAWSADIFFRELDVLYAACCAQTRPLLAELPIQYADYAVWQREWLQGEVLEQHLAYWKDHLSGAPAVLELPTDHPRPPVQTYNGRRSLFTLPAALSDALEVFSRKMGVTLYMTLLAAFQTLLARYTGQHDIVVGTPIAGRGRVELEGLIGLFANTLALRGNLSGNPTFVQFLMRIREVCLGAYAHQELPFERLVEEVGPERTLSYHPLFQVMFILQNARELPRLAGLEVTSIETARSASMFDLTLSLWKESAQLHGFFEYNADLFESATIERMVGHWQRLLEGCVATPEQRISRLPLLPDEERQRLLVEWNQTQADYPEDRCIHQLFEQQVERTPDAIAVVYEQQALTYRALDEHANRLANYLRHRYDIGPESRVGLALERSLDLVIAILAVLKAGAAYVPIDPEYPQERIAFVLQDATVPVLLAQTALKERLPVQDDLMQTPVVWLDVDQERIALEPDAAPPSRVLAENLAYTIYTSGSTGRPKGVQISHRAVVNFLCAMRSQLGVTERDAWPALTSLSFDIAGLEVFLPLLVGARIVLVGRDATRDANELAGLLTAGGVTVIQATPATWQILLEAGWRGRLEMRLLCGGEALSPDLARRLRESGAVLWNMYGPTETTIWSMCERVERVDGAVPIGRPLANTYIYLLDAQLEPVPIGVPGELYIGGDGVGRGYWQRPHLTAERFVPDPFSAVPGMRLYKTGDLARYRPDGTIEFLGRTDHQVKMRGYRIELQEIEAVLRQHPAVREAVVRVWEVQPGDRRLVAYVVAAPDQVPSSSDVHTFLSAHLPTYMVPAMVVPLEALPLTPNGKVDRRALPEPERSRAGHGNTYVAPTSQTEQVLAGIWAQVLGVEQIGITDNFFESGGDSILSIQIVARATAAGLPLSPRLLFQHQTIAQLAMVIQPPSSVQAEQGLGQIPLTPIQQGQSSDASGSTPSDFPEAMLSQAALDGLLARLSVATPPQKGDERVKPEIEAMYPLSPMQEGMLFHCLYDPDSEVYFEQFTSTLQGSLNIPAFQQAWRQVIAQHSILRTLFLWEGLEMPLQIVLRQVDLPWSEIDWRSLPSSTQDERIQDWLRTDRTRGFDLTQAPLLRLSVMRLSEQATRFTWSFHHLLLDGWSVATVLGQVFACYEAVCAGQLLALPPARPYRDYIRWVRQQSLPLAEGFWRKTLQGFTAATPLGVDRTASNDAASASSYQEHVLSFPASTTAALQELARREHLTLNTVVQGAWALLLARYSGESDVVFGVTVSGRSAELPGVESMVGLFINTLPLRVQVDPRQRLLPWLRALQEQQSEARQYEYSPLAQVQRWSEVPGGQPLFESLLVFENYPVDASFEQNSSVSIEQGQAVERTNYPLTVAVAIDTHLVLRVSSMSSRFEGEVIQRLASHLQVVLDGMVVHPEQRLGYLPLLTEAEWRQIVGEWNATAAASMQHGCLPALFQEQAERTPDAIALVWAEEQVTYATLNQLATHLAYSLRSLGVTTEHLVGVCLERSPALVASLLAVLKAGGAYLPLDPTYPASRLSFMLQDAQAAVVITTSPVLQKLAHLHLQEIRLICLDHEDEWRQLGEHSPTSDAIACTPESLAYIIYTSGSTGQPKGVQVTHRGLRNLISWHQQAFALTPQDRATQLASWSFDAAGWELWPYLTTGAVVHLVDEEIRESPERLQAWLRERQITISFLPTPLAEHMMDGTWLPDLSVRTLLTGGDLLHRAPEKRMPFVFVNNYGPTENTVVTTSGVVEAAPGEAPTPSIGRPIANTSCYILDAQFQPVPVGITGELYIAGSGLARGYLRRPDLTAERFLPHPFRSEPGARFYKTGDLARYRPDGSIDFLGRNDTQVKLRGFRIEIGEIEAVLRQHPAVREAAVRVWEPQLGERRLVAYVVAAPDQVPSSSEMHAFLSTHLPLYMMPAVFVPLEALPLTLNGKVDRQALPVPESSRAGLGNAFVAPTSQVERVLVDIWTQVLGVEQVGMTDNYFALGGDSILSLQIVSRATAAGLPLTPRLLFQYQTIAELATVVGARPAGPIGHERVSGPVPLTPIVHWFFQQSLPDPQHWNQALLLEVRQPLRFAVLQRALQALLTHHDMLRLRAQQHADGWHLAIAAPEASEPLPLVQVDLSALPVAEQGPALASAASSLQASVRLASGPIVCAALFHLGSPQPDRLLVAMHHLAVDIVSWSILLADLQQAARQISQTRPLRLPPRTTSFQRWAESLGAYAQSLERRQHVDFWLGQPWEAIRPLLIDDPAGRQANTEASARTVRSTLSVEDTQALLFEVPNAYHTQINEVFLTALALAFARWTGQRALLVHLEGHGREDVLENVDLSRTVGWFTSLAPLVLALEDTQDVGAALKSIKEQVRRVPLRGLSFGLARYLSQDEDSRARLAALPRPEISFNYAGRSAFHLGEDELFAIAAEDPGASRSPRNPRAHLLDLNASMEREQLLLEWTYSDRVHARATIEGLAHLYLEALRDLIQHCQSPEAGGFTPSDFPDAALTQSALDALLATLRRDREKPVGVKQVEAIYPLSPMQEGMLFHSLSNSLPGAYFEQIAWRMHGNLDVAAFQRAWQEVMAHHAILRTLFLWEHLDTFLQVVLRHVDLPWTEEDWQGDGTLPADEQSERLHAWLRADRTRGFELAHAPLFRVHLIHLDDRTVHITWSFHHLLLDGWSASTLLKQVFTCYEAIQQGQDVALPASRPYREYIRWVRQQDLSLAERFWRQALRGFRTPPSLDVNRPPRARRWVQAEEEHGDRDIQLTAATTAALQDLARREGLTLNTLVQGAWALLLARYSGTSDVVFGVIVSGRPAGLAGVESMVGLFINTLPLRACIEPRQSLMPWLRRLQAHQAEARQYEYSPLVQVQGWSEVPRGQPLFESLLIFENYPVDASSMPLNGLVISEAQVTERTHYPLTVTVIPGAGLRLHISYLKERFEATMIQQLGTHLHTLLKDMLAHPDQRLEHLSLLTEGERQQMLVEWNATHTAHPRDQSIPDLFEAQVQRTPDAVALLFEDQHLTYEELDRRANCLARSLQRLGVGPEALVGVCLERSPALVMGLLGVLKAGGAYVPLDPASPRDRLGVMLADMQTSYAKGGQPRPPVLLTQQSLLAALPPVETQIVLIDAGWTEMAHESEEHLASQVRGDHLASVIYTSGSTGQPKGVAGTHQATVNRLQWMWERFPFAASEVCCQKTSIGFVDSIWELVGPLLQGIRTVIIADGSAKDPQRLVRTLSQQSITRIVLVPSLLQAMLETCPGLETDLAGLQYLISSGETLGVELATRWRSLLPHCILLNLYGSSEVAADATYYPIASCEGRTRIPIGRPIANTQVYVLDAQLGLVPPGVPGGLAIGGLGLARGYLNQPALTAERFVPDPWSKEPGARLYWTGDLGYAQPDGTLEFLGRSDRQVKIHGSRIELGEIEAALVQHPAVREGMVVARAEPGGEQRLAAYVVLREEDPNGLARATGATAGERRPLTLATLRAFLREKVPAYMLPSAMVRLPALPLLPNGKVDRRGLSVPGGLPLVEPEPEADEETEARPQTAIEEVLSGVWEEVLGLKRVGIFDNFFDVGGDSLRAIRVISRLRALFQVEISVMDLFEAPTVAGLAAVLLTYETVAGRISAIANVRLKLKRMSAREVQEQLQQKKGARGQPAEAP